MYKTVKSTINSQSIEKYLLTEQDVDGYTRFSVKINEAAGLEFNGTLSFKYTNNLIKALDAYQENNVYKKSKNPI